MKSSSINHLLVLLLAFSSLSAQASLTLLNKEEWKISLSGFVALDTYLDTTRSYTESLGSLPVERSEVVGGRTGRTQFSVRNSRLGLEVTAPGVGAWSTRGYLEFDFLGTNPSPGTTGATEGTLFTSPTFRARQAFVETGNESWKLIAGQDWSLFGWQPYYFHPSGDINMIAGSAYSREPQLKVTHTYNADQGDATTWQFAAAVVRPPQRDAQIPSVEAGARVLFAQRNAGANFGATAPRVLAPMSFGLSGTTRELVVPRAGGQTGELSYFEGAAGAFNFFVPVLAAGADVTDVGNTLAVLGEATIGRGYGDRFNGWTGNLSTNPIGSNMDAGIGGSDSQGNFRLIELRTLNAQFLYHAPTQTHSWIAGGYGQIYSSNAGLFVAGNGLRVYNRQQTHFVNLYRDFTAHLRGALGYVLSTTEYGDSQITRNHRFQLSTWFSF